MTAPNFNPLVTISSISAFYQNKTDKLKTVHNALILICQCVICVLLFIIFKFDIEVQPSILVLIFLFIVILQSTVTYITNFNNMPLDENIRIKVNNRIYCMFSFVCNYLYLWAKIIIGIIILILAIICVHICIEMQAMILPSGKFMKFIDFFGLFGPIFGPKKVKIKKVAYYTLNPKMATLHNMFDLRNIFNHIATNDVHNWKIHGLVLLIGVIMAIIIGGIGIDYKKPCNESNDNFETRIKSQFTTWLVITSLVLCFSYSILLFFKMMK